MVNSKRLVKKRTSKKVSEKNISNFIFKLVEL